MTELDLPRQQQAKRYARLRRRLMLLDLLLGSGYLLCWLLLGWAAAWRNALIGVTNNHWLLVAGFGLLLGGGYWLLQLPLSYYAGFLLPHRFELATQTLRSWISDQLKMLLLGGLFGGLFLEVLYGLLRRAPQSWWLWMAGLMMVWSVLLANLAPVLILPLFYRSAPLGEEHAGLVECLLRLAEKARTRVQGVFKIEMSSRTKAANAALIGLGNTRRIVLFDTLLATFTDDEIEVILAHELAHHVHHDVGLGLLVESVIGLVGLYLTSWGLRWGTGQLGFRGIADVAGMPLLALLLGAFELVVLPLTNGFSRWRERRADSYALRVTGNAPAFVSAFKRLANQNLAEVDPEPWVEFLLYSHPALRKRIERAASQARDESPA